MTRTPRIPIALLLVLHLVWPAAAWAGGTGPDQLLRGRSRFELPKPVLASAAAQTSPAGKPKSPGRRFLRNTLIGAAIGAAAAGFIASSVGGDCGDCSGDVVNGALQGAFYGALVGMAVSMHPSRRPFPARAGRGASLSVAVRF